MKRTIDESHTIRAGAFTVTTTAEPLVFDTDPEVIAEPVAEAIRDAVARGIQGITAKGHDGHQLFNRTGKLADGLAVERVGEAYVITAPPGRLEGPAGEAMLERLAELVPAIRDPLGDAGVQKAIEASAERMIKVGR